VRDRVVAVQPGSPADKAGIRVGDSVSSAAPTPIDHLRRAAPEPGDALQFRVLHAGIRRIVTLRAVSGQRQWPPLFLTIWRLGMLLAAALIAWRRPEDPAARNLVAFLIAFGIAIALDNNALPNSALSFVVLFLGTVCTQFFGLGAVVRFAATFPTGSRSDTRALIARAATIASIIGIIAFVAANVAIIFWNAASPNTNVVIGLILALLVLAAIANFMLGFRKSSAADRQRILWLLLTFAVGFTGPFVAFIAIAMGAYNSAIDNFGGLTLIVLPIGLGYVILRHRLLDIGFVINRAIVFAFLSAFVVLVFAALEWVLGKYFFSAAASASIQLAGALLLGLSLRPVHARIDRFVDDVFFQERHRSEAALRRFAREALLISNEQTLLDQTLEIAQQCTRARSVQILIDANDGAYAVVRSLPYDVPGTPVSRDDPAFLYMRTWHAAVDLTEKRTALRGEFAFPFIVRGNVSGALACGSKPGHAPYAPDELAALEEVARGVGLAYDALEVAALQQEVMRIEGSDAAFKRIQERFHSPATADGVALSLEGVGPGSTQSTTQ
ncbi:MAG: hypothetical protein JO024_02925, partial [Candidatus Eremiobacteraeota bacterium]|nr:hypothetical protein [Candidatus Eremiobacteraeota bacterium]